MRYESCGGFSHYSPKSKYKKSSTIYTKHLTLYRKTGIIKVEIEKIVNKIKGVNKMKTHKILVEEVLSRVVEVEAETLGDAKALVHEQYSNQDIVLDDGDYSGEPLIIGVDELE